MSCVFQNIDPPPPPPYSARLVCTPRLAGGGHTRREERGWGFNILEDARHSSLLYLYRILFALPTLCLTLTDSGEQVARSCGKPDRHAGDILSLAYHEGRLYTAGDDGLIKVHITSVLVIYTALLMYCTQNLQVITEIGLFHRNSFHRIFVLTFR
jgi:hypothetical protein